MTEVAADDVSGGAGEPGPTEWGENPNGVGPWAEEHDTEPADRRALRPGTSGRG